MTQDQYGRGQGPGYVVGGEVVPDDEIEAPQDDGTTPMTRFQKVASALRGDRSTQPTAEQDTATDPSATDPNGTWPARSDEAATVGRSGAEDTVDDALADPAGTDEVGAVRSPDAGNRDYWDDEQRGPETAPDGGRIVTDPSMTGQGAYGTTAPTGTGGIAPAAGYGSQAGTAAGYGAEAGTASGYGTQGGTATDPQGPAGAGPAGTTDGTLAAGTTDGTFAAGTTEGSPAGRHAAGVTDAGLRPGEATDRIGDFGDIAFGNLLPDAEQYTTQWQQIQFRFVDDPQGSVTEAADVVSQVTAKLEAAIQERQRAIQERQRAIQERQRAIQERASALRGRWGEGANADTETLRETLRMYRAFMDQLIGSTR